MNPQALSKREQLAELLATRQRKHFPQPASQLYLNFGAQGLLAEPALAAIKAAYAQLQEFAPFSLEQALQVMEVQRDTREILAHELDGQPDAFAFAENTSVACNQVFWSIHWKAGDRLLIGDQEYPGVVRAAKAMASRFGVEIATFETDLPAEQMLASLDAALKPRTRLVLVSHALWNRPRVLPLAEIAARVHRVGARLLVDGAQGAGTLPLALRAWKIDFYAFTAHKWWCGPEGVGALYLDPEAAAELAPAWVGWRGFVLEGNQVAGVASDARRFEIGTSSPALLAGWLAVLKLHRQWGDAAARAKRSAELAAELCQRLEAGRAAGWPLELEGPGTGGNGLVFFRPTARKNTQVRDALAQAGIAIRTLPDSPLLRVSIHYFNLREELERLLQALPLALGPS